MKKYKFTAIRGFTQAYEITIEAKNEEEARWKAYDLKYNNGNEWTEVGDLEADDKLIDIGYKYKLNPKTFVSVVPALSVVPPAS